MGRKPKPTRLKVLDGSAKHDPQRVNRDEPEPPLGIPPEPAGLSKVASAKWVEVTAILDEMGVLTTADVDTLEVYCRTYADYLLAHDSLVKDGFIFRTTDAHGNDIIHQNPASREVQRCTTLLLKIAAEFGLTPSGRTRVKVERKSEPAIQPRRRTRN